MVKLRVVLFFLTLAVVGVVGYILSFYARGYRFDPNTFKVLPNGILVIKSNPDGAQVLINGELETATPATINLPPDVYDITVRKEGFMEWKKRLTIEKEIVTEADAHLFRVVPSLSAVTFSGVSSPLISPDLTKVAYIVPSSSNGQDQGGLWIMDTVNLPLGFSREPRRITDGDLKEAIFSWSPDGRQILLKTILGFYLLDTGTFTPQSARVNILATQEKVLSDWKVLETKKKEAKITPLPDDLEDILRRKTQSFVFAPDESKILYTVSADGTLKEDLIQKVPGASTQPQERELKKGKTYVYDLKEDRNFVVDTDSDNLNIEVWNESPKDRRMFWFISSRHLVLAESGKVTMMDLDGTNRQVVYSGSYISPFVLSAPSIDRLLILTNLGADTTPPNIYSLSLK